MPGHSLSVPTEGGAAAGHHFSLVAINDGAKKP